MDKSDKVWRINKNDEKPKVRNCDQQLLNGAYFGNWQVVKKWVEAGGNPNYMEERDGWLPIHYAARWGDMRMLLLLLKAGADIDGKTNSNETALHKAARWNRREIAIALLKRGAKIEIKNGDGNKAADMTTEQWMKDIINHFEEFLANEKIENEKKIASKAELEQKLAERKKDFGY